MSNIYQLATDAEAKLNNVAFSERVQKVVSALIAIEVLPLKRSEQHAILHNKFASLFVHALERHKNSLMSGYVVAESEDLVMQKVGTNVKYKVTEG